MYVSLFRIPRRRGYSCDRRRRLGPFCHVAYAVLNETIAQVPAWSLWAWCKQFGLLWKIRNAAFLYIHVHYIPITHLLTMSLPCSLCYMSGKAGSECRQRHIEWTILANTRETQTIFRVDKRLRMNLIVWISIQALFHLGLIMPRW